MKVENPSAFPFIEEQQDKYGNKFNETEYGMTLRDYFAARSIANHPKNGYDAKGIARYAYEVSDAMLKERIKPIKQ